MNTLNPMANLYMADPKEQKEPQQKHSREVQTTSVDIKYGIKAMRVLAVIIYVLVGISLFVSLVCASEDHKYEPLPLIVICGSIIPISIGLILRKVADIAEYISDKIK